MLFPSEQPELGAAIEVEEGGWGGGNSVLSLAEISLRKRLVLCPCLDDLCKLVFWQGSLFMESDGLEGLVEADEAVLVEVDGCDEGTKGWTFAC